MVELEFKDQDILLEPWQNRRELASERQRRQVLKNAGLGDLAPLQLIDAAAA